MGGSFGIRVSFLGCKLQTGHGFDGCWGRGVPSVRVQVYRVSVLLVRFVGFCGGPLKQVVLWNSKRVWRFRAEVINPQP